MALSTNFPDAEGARAIFRVPQSTLQSQTEDGGIDLIDVAAKCRALFLTRFRAKRDRSGSLTAEWFNVRASLPARKNRPQIHVITPTLGYLLICIHEWGFMENEGLAETVRAFKRRVFDTLRTMSTADRKKWMCASCSFSQPLTGQ
jgi:hypothetical protein